MVFTSFLTVNKNFLEIITVPALVSISAAREYSPFGRVAVLNNTDHSSLPSRCTTPLILSMTCFFPVCDSSTKTVRLLPRATTLNDAVPNTVPPSEIIVLPIATDGMIEVLSGYLSGNALAGVVGTIGVVTDDVAILLVVGSIAQVFASVNVPIWSPLRLYPLFGTPLQ